MTRSTPLKPGKGFKRPTWTPKPCKTMDDYTPKPREAAVARVDGRARMVVPVPKENPLQHGAYMAAVRRLPCARCGVMGPWLIQFCHADEGKGERIKTDCRRGWPGCGPRFNNPGCHWLVGTSGQLGKQGRREFEEAAGVATRAMIRARGEWPADLPPWPEDEQVAAP